MVRLSDFKIKSAKAPKKNPDPFFVQRNLQPFVKNRGQKSWFLNCPFHSDRKTPSLSVIVNYGYRQPVGFWKCFGCGEKGYWNKLAEALNMETLDGFQYDLTETESINFGEEEKESIATKKVKLDRLIPWPADRTWRGFSGKVVQKYDGYLNKFDPDYPLVFLCRHRNSKKVIGFIRCRVKKHKILKSYLFSKNTWTSEYIWPEHKLPLTQQFVVVEGVRDALAWLCRGVVTGAILGTSSGMGDRRKATLMGMNVEETILFMDGDKAGKLAVYGKKKDGRIRTIGLKALLEEDFKIRVFKTWKYYKDLDPFKLAKDKDFTEKFKRWLEVS